RRRSDPGAGQRRPRLSSALGAVVRGRSPRQAMSLYLYALVGRPVRRPLGRGLGGEALRLIEVARLLVVAGRIDNAPRVTPTALRRHDATVRRLAGRTDAVLPIRFGTVVGDRLALARALAPRAAGLREALALVAGHEQMTLRGDAAAGWRVAGGGRGPRGRGPASAFAPDAVA